MTVTFPAGTGLSGVNGAVFDVASGQSVGSCFAAQGQSIECFLFSGAVIDPGDQVRITFSGVTNPSSAGSRTLSVFTTSDTAPVTSPSYTVVANNPLTGVTLTLDSLAASATTRWVVNFTTSATGGLSAGRQQPDDGDVPGRHRVERRQRGGVRRHQRPDGRQLLRAPRASRSSASCSAARSSTPATRCGSPSAASPTPPAPGPTRSTPRPPPTPRPSPPAKAATRSRPSR